jgi:cytokinesis protein
MVKLIQIDRLRPRIDGMLYRISFDEQWGLLDDVSRLRLMTAAFLTPWLQSARKLSEAGKGLMSATQFKELLNVCVVCFYPSPSLTVTTTQTAYSTYWELYEWNGY